MFLPPIGTAARKPPIQPPSEGLTLYTGGLTVYCFGDPAKMSDAKCRLALRIHDEVSHWAWHFRGPHATPTNTTQCNGSDVFGSDICTCRPYLIFGIEEAVKEAQNGGSGVVIYFRKEGRALGEVTKAS